MNTLSYKRAGDQVGEEDGYLSTREHIRLHTKIQVTTSVRVQCEYVQ